MNNEYHICSFIVQTRPEHMEEIKNQLVRLPGVELHQQDPKGKVIITLEAESTRQISEITTAIGHLSGVLSCNMVFHQIENQSATSHSL